MPLTGNNQIRRSTQPGHPSVGRRNKYHVAKGRWFAAGE